MKYSRNEVAFFTSRMTLTFPFKTDFTFSKRNAVFSSLALISLGIIFIYCQYSYFTMLQTSVSSFSAAIEYPEHFLMVFSPIAHILLMFIHRKVYERIFRTLQPIGDIKTEFPFLIFYFFCISEYSFAYCPEYFEKGFKFFVGMSLYAFFYWLHSQQVLQIVSLLSTVQKRFERLFAKPHFAESDLHKYTELVRVARKIAVICGPEFLLNLVLVFMKVIMHSYTLYRQLVYLSYGVDWTKTVHNSIQLVYIFTELISLVSACQNVKLQAETFNTELFRLIRDSSDLCRNKKLSLYVTVKQTVNFTACGFFSLGYPLVTSIIAAATTYLVILIQFSVPPSS